MDEFVSTYTNKVDAKGRVSIPAQYRAVLAVDGFDGIYCCPTLDRQAVDAGGNRFREAIREQPRQFRAVLRRPRIPVDDADRRERDPEARFRGPRDPHRTRIKEYAGLGERVTFVGQGYKFQIWEPERFTQYREEAKNRLRDLRRTLGGRRRDGRKLAGGRMSAGRDTSGIATAADRPPHSGDARRGHRPARAASAGGIFIDGTFGAGGYTPAILAAGASVIAIDRDPSAIAAGAALVDESGGRLTLVEGRFSDLDAIAAAHGTERVDGVVLDVGVSSMQLDDAARGFSFRLDGPLDMRMGGDGPSAADVVNRFEPRDLARVIAVLGEEKRARGRRVGHRQGARARGA